MTVRWLVRACALLVGAASLAACDLGGDLQGIAVDPPREMPTFAFTRADGSTVTTSADPGRPMVLFFGYTHCPDVCPTTLADWKRVRVRLGDEAQAVRFVFVTIDPARDTPTVAERYARMYDASFEGLSGDASTTSRMMDAFGVAAARDPGTNATGYLVSHSSQVFLVDSHGKLVALYPFGSGWDALAADLERLL
ncbi:SCO family protein [Gemmatimonas sp.]|uniref:SCO family protein n=1 Tax=Gemmatimonas sp. TaxID=1962908 RepID=UPI003983AE74